MGRSTSLQAAPKTRRSPLSTHRWLRTTSSTSPFSPRCAAATPRAPSATARALTGGLPARVPLTCPCSAPDLARITPDLPRSRQVRGARARQARDSDQRDVRGGGAGELGGRLRDGLPGERPNDLARSRPISRDLFRSRATSPFATALQANAAQVAMAQRAGDAMARSVFCLIPCAARLRLPARTTHTGWRHPRPDSGRRHRAVQPTSAFSAAHATATPASLPGTAPATLTSRRGSTRPSAPAACRSAWAIPTPTLSPNPNPQPRP